jgi:hypothetical protein
MKRLAVEGSTTPKVMITARSDSNLRLKPRLRARPVCSGSHLNKVHEGREGVATTCVNLSGKARDLAFRTPPTHSRERT